MGHVVFDKWEHPPDERRGSSNGAKQGLGGSNACLRVSVRRDLRWGHDGVRHLAEVVEQCAEHHGFAIDAAEVV